eukprot:15353699-Ditylum_brightwellii.AAC.1
MMIVTVRRLIKLPCQSRHLYFQMFSNKYAVGMLFTKEEYDMSKPLLKNYVSSLKEIAVPPAEESILGLGSGLASSVLLFIFFGGFSPGSSDEY